MNNLNIIKIFKKFLDVILPPRCFSCGVNIYDDGNLCEKCFIDLNFISQPFCIKCGKPFENIENQNIGMKCANCLNGDNDYFRYSRSAVAYDESSKKLIIPFKFNDKTENAKILAKILQNSVLDILKDYNQPTLIVPVPLHYNRMLKRKYNQSALIVKELVKLVNISADYKSLKRVKKTKPQVQFKGKERLKNVKYAFEVKFPDNIRGQRVILLDDVMTTGATMKDCVRALNKAGAKSVDLISVARVI